MIIVTGSALGTAETIAEMTREAIAHSQRSRAEPGCIAHGVHADAEDPLRLTFFEIWSDEAGLKAHFALPASRAIVKTLRALALSLDGIQIYRAETTTI